MSRDDRRRRLLLVAYHYPPIQESSGVHRALSWSKYLPGFGWDPVVLTVTPTALIARNDDNYALIPAGVDVVRAWALDTARQLSIKGRYLDALARPDRWMTWLYGGVVAGLYAVLTRKPSVIVSTYPIATAHRIGYCLHRLTGLPWIADFRDPMAQEDYPSDPRVWRAFKAIEEQAVLHAARLVFTTPGALRYYQARYGAALGARGTVIENGYDEALFAGLPKVPARTPPPAGCVTLLHAGILYPHERDPRQFFAAVKALREARGLGPGQLRIVFRGSGHDGQYRDTLRELGIDDIVQLLPGVSYTQVIEEMGAATALLIFQSAGCNNQIPAKTYEYIRTGRPVLAFTDSAGDTADLLRRSGLEWIAPLDDAARIQALLGQAYDALLEGAPPGPSLTTIDACSRHGRAGDLARVLNEVAGDA